MHVSGKRTSVRAAMRVSSISFAAVPASVNAVVLQLTCDDMSLKALKSSYREALRLSSR